MKLTKWKPELSITNEIDNINCDFYFVNYPSDYWHEKNDISVTNNYSINKKIDFCNILNVKYLLSPTENDSEFITKSFSECCNKTKIFHVGSEIKFKYFNQIFKMFKILLLVVKIFKKNYKLKSNKLNFCVYNVELVYLPLYIFLKIIGFKLVLQLEDNYLVYYKDFYIRRILYMFSHNLFDIVISSNENNFKYFNNNQKKIHYNGFINFNDAPFRNDIEAPKFVFGGTLNELRGLNILNDLIDLLYASYNDFELHITGDVVDINDKNVFVHGFLDTSEYVKLLKKCDYGLVLQSTSGIGEGFFPSKTLDYNDNGLFILTLET